VRDRSSHTAKTDYLLVINAGTREKDLNWVRENTKGFDACRGAQLRMYTNWQFRVRAAQELCRNFTDASRVIKNYWFTHGRFLQPEEHLIDAHGAITAKGRLEI